MWRNRLFIIILLLLIFLFTLVGVFTLSWSAWPYVLGIIILLLLSSLLRLVSVNRPSRPAGTYSLDHFKVYDVRDVPLLGEKGPGRPVFTQGQFDAGPKPGILLAVTHFANPATKTLKGDPPSTLQNSRAHLTWYRLEETVLDPTRQVTFTNQFGKDQKIVIDQAHYLLLPTSKLLDRPPDNVPEELDHYKCYEVIEETDVNTGETVKIEDQFSVDEAVIVGDLVYFCVPANKFLGPEASSPGLLNPVDHLAVYEIPKTHGPVPPFKTKDQFQDYPGFQIISSEFLCVPSKKIAFEDLPSNPQPWPRSLPQLPTSGSRIVIFAAIFTRAFLFILGPLIRMIWNVLMYLRILPRGPARDIDTFFNNATTQSVFATSVTPLIDAEENFPAIESLIEDAERFIYIVNLGLDEKTNIKHTDQIYQSGRPESEWLSIEKALKNRIARNSSPPLEIKILLWNTFVFADADQYSGDFSDVGDMIVVRKRWGDVNGPDPQTRTFGQFLTRIRRVSCARRSILEKFYEAYRGERDGTVLPFPTGIEVALEKHPTRWTLGSHHQKIILTDKGAWVAGMNLLKHHWDTQQHFFKDPLRAHSGEGLVFHSEGNNLPWHDTGALVRGDSALRQIFKDLWKRWDTALRHYQPYTHLGSVVSNYSGTLTMYLNSRQVTNESKFNGGGRPFNSVPDRPLVVRSNIAVSMPRGSGRARRNGVVDIKEHYWRSLDAMAGQRSFIYIETQFFTSHAFTKAVFSRWKINIGSRTEPDTPFCYIMIPYIPDPDLPDPSVSGDWSDISKDETQNLKWLEIKTARVIYKRDNRDHWVAHAYVPRPQRQIEFEVPAVDSDPASFKPDKKFKVISALKLNPDETFYLDPQGNRVQISFSLKAEEVMTRSDIMAYTLITTLKRDGTDILPNTLSGSDVRDRLHEFLAPNHVYVHSKSSVFLNKENDLYIGTIGSANISIRSFDDAGDHQDSEMNVWWTGKAHVEAYRSKLWVHHLRLPNPQLADENQWQTLGWQNLRDIMLARGRRLDGDVVRLDVIDRMDKLSTLPFGWIP